MMGAILLRGAAFALVWWMLAEGRADSWGVGMVSVAAAVSASLYLSPPGAGRLSLAGLPGFAGFFLMQSFRGGAQVAAQAFRPRIDLAPALLELPVTLPEGPPRALLVNTLNLLPRIGNPTRRVGLSSTLAAPVNRRFRARKPQKRPVSRLLYRLSPGQVPLAATFRATGACHPMTSDGLSLT